MAELRVLQIEDQEDDAILIANELRRGGFTPRCTRVDTVPDLRAALARDRYDLITCDHGLPRFDAPSAISLVHEMNGDEVPFIIVSGSISERAAHAALAAGAHGVVSKSDLKTLVPIVRHELDEARARLARRAAEERFLTLARSLDGIVVTIDTSLAIDGVYGRGLLGGRPVPEALLGTHVHDFFDPSERGLVDGACRRVLSGQRGDEILELHRAHADGIAHLQLTISPMHGNSGTV